MPANTIVCEGVDCSGKSSICEELNRMLKGKQFHFAFPRGANADQKYGFQWGQFDMLFEMINLMEDGTWLVLDRAWVGEYVYGPLYRGKNPEYLLDLEKKWKTVNPNVALFHVQCDPNVVAKRHAARGEEVPSVEDIAATQDGFSKFCKQSPFYRGSVRTDAGDSPEKIALGMINVIINLDDWKRSNAGQ